MLPCRRFSVPGLPRDLPHLFCPVLQDDLGVKRATEDGQYAESPALGSIDLSGSHHRSFLRLARRPGK